MPLRGQMFWGHIWKRTVEKNQTNATNATFPLFRQAIWGYIWKPTVEKSQTNVTCVIMHLRMQAIWGHIWKHTVEKSQTNATIVIMRLLRQIIWGYMWKCTLEKTQNAHSRKLEKIKEWSEIFQLSIMWFVYFYEISNTFLHFFTCCFGFYTSLISLKNNALFNSFKWTGLLLPLIPHKNSNT